MSPTVQEPLAQPPKDLIGFLDFYLVQKAPFQLPAGAKDMLVRFGPWIALVLIVISLPVLLLALGLSTLVAPWLLGPTYAAGFGLATLGSIVQMGLLIAALPGLFARKMSGWTLAFYGELVGIVASLLAGGFVAAIIGGLIGLYLMFQIRPLYRT